jgi:preprotein translocase subunit SecA
MRIFGSDRIAGLMQRLGMEEGVPIEHGMVTRAIERAQKQVEAQNFSVRKHLLEYDDVMNKQRENTYTLRRSLLEDRITLDEDGEPADAHQYLMALAGDVLDDLVERFVGADTDAEDWDVPGLRQEVARVYGFEDAELAGIAFDELNTGEIRDALWARIEQAHAGREALLGPEFMRKIERDIMLQIVDQQWKDHLYSLDHLKEGIGLRGYGQRDPLVEYKRESFALFQDMKARVEDDIVRHLWHLRAVPASEGALPPAARPAPRRAAPMTFNDPGAVPSAFGGAAPAAVAEPASPFAPRPSRVGGDDAPIKTQRREEPKIGRNDPCWCGSGKKYKKCHGANA